MANDLFSGLVKGLANFMPQDDPAAKIVKAQAELDDLHRKENEIYAEIGRAAVQREDVQSYSSELTRLQLIQSNMVEAEGRLRLAKEEQEAKERAEREARERLTCPSCASVNPEGVKFCQECGARMERAPEKAVCPSCGAENAPGTRFCGECGTRLE